MKDKRAEEFLSCLGNGKTEYQLDFECDDIDREYECEKCYETFNKEEMIEHVKENKHYTFKLIGTKLILCYL